MAQAPDDFSDSFYYRAIRTRIGETLRTLFIPAEPPPNRLLDLLHALDDPKGGGTGGTEERPDGTADPNMSPAKRPKA
jgi:hypothetical protein